MKVLILDDSTRAMERASDIVAETLSRKPDAVLGLTTGGTMLPLYADLRRRHSQEWLSFAGVASFDLDEYIDLAPQNPCSYHHYMRAALFDHIDIDPARTHLPRGGSPDMQAKVGRYEHLIAAAGGNDLQILGIGQNGHIGFHEPISSLASRARIKMLTEGTRRANQRYFSSYEETPRYALAMGIATILEARGCLLLATGQAKAEAIAQMIEGPVSAACPASALQLHPRVTVILDGDAASRLRLVEYYHHMHPGGAESAFG